MFENQKNKKYVYIQRKIFVLWLYLSLWLYSICRENAAFPLTLVSKFLFKLNLSTRKWVKLWENTN